MGTILVVNKYPSPRSFPDHIVAFPLTNRDIEAPWMAFDSDGQTAFQSSSEKWHAVYCIRKLGLDNVADNIENAVRLSEDSMQSVIDYARTGPALWWGEMLRDRQPIVIDADFVDVFLGVEGTISLIDRDQRTTIETSPFHIVFRHRIDIMRNAIRVFEAILSDDIVNPFRALYDRTALDVIYRIMISRSWANHDWLKSRK